MRFREWEPKRDREIWTELLKQYQARERERRPKMTEQERLENVLEGLKVRVAYMRLQYENRWVDICDMDERIRQVKEKIKKLVPARDGETWTQFEISELTNKLEVVMKGSALHFARKESAIAWKAVKLLIRVYDLPFKVTNINSF